MMSPGTAVPPDPRAYVRIAGMLREMISSQVLPPGSPAPSITRLCREHGHARQTCGRAMRLLEDEGLLHRVPGLGYYVTGGNAGITPSGTFAAGPGLRVLGPDRRNGERGPAESPERPAIRAWNAIRRTDGATRGAFRAVRNNLHSHDWPVRQVGLACSSLVLNSQFSPFIYPM